jgi:hypothetical protein
MHETVQLVELPIGSARPDRPSRAQSRAQAKSKRRRRRRRDAIVGTVSITLLTIVGAYVTLPGSSAMAMTVQEGHDPEFGHDVSHHYRDCPVSHHGHQSRASEVIYGDIATKRAVHVSKVSVKIQGTTHSNQDETAQIAVGASGAYRAVVHLPDGPYKVTIDLTKNGQHARATKTVRLVDDRAYDVSATVGRGSIFTFLPVSSY